MVVNAGLQITSAGGTTARILGNIPITRSKPIVQVGSRIPPGPPKIFGPGAIREKDKQARKDEEFFHRFPKFPGSLPILKIFAILSQKSTLQTAKGACNRLLAI
jgi:hypothetical protein